MKFVLYLLPACWLLVACSNGRTTEHTAMNQPTQGTFGYDLDFLQKHDSDLTILTSTDSTAQVIVSAKYQGKVFTSTASGPSGRSFGWVNYKAFNGMPDAHMNAYGGENRLWLGPEGAQYSLFFKPGTRMEFTQWHTPPAFDTEAWQMVSKTGQSVSLEKAMKLTNYAGADFNLKINRTVTLLSYDELISRLNTPLPGGLQFVGYQTENTLSNTGTTAWTKKTGAPCLWMLDMFVPSPDVTILIPYDESSTDDAQSADARSADAVAPTDRSAGAVAKTDYFGQIPPDRVTHRNGMLYFKADGKSRGKLGLSPQRAKTMAGSYDARNHILTLTLFDIDKQAAYLNQEWKVVDAPYNGDAVNAYNDGPLADGSQMGPFYEIESVSPAAFLKPGSKLTHNHAVIHLTGTEASLNRVAKKTLGVSLETIKNAFGEK